MKIILNDYIEHLGERGDSVVVKPGFARNYLLPKSLAYPDTPGNRRRFDEEQKHWEEMDLGRRSAAEGLAKDFDGIELLFERRAGERDVLFGSVSVADIAKELSDKGIDIDRKRIMLEHPIKKLGNFEVEFNIHRDIQVTLPVFVVRPGEEPNRDGDVTEVTAVEEAPAAEVVETEVVETEVVETEVVAETEVAAEPEPVVE